MWERIREIIRKEFRQVLRDPRSRALLFAPPIIQLLIFGYAVNMDVEQCAIGWYDQDRTPQSRDLRASFEGSHHFEVTRVISSEEEVRKALDGADVRLVVLVLPGFARDLSRGETAGVQLLVDGTNSNTAAIASSYAAQVIAGYAQRAMSEVLSRRLVAPTMLSGGPVSFPGGGIKAQPRVWFNENLKSRNYFIPGVVVNIIALVTVMLTAMSIVREKEIGTMEQLMVTPIRPIELMLGKLLPFAMIGMFEVALVVSAALLVFGIPFRGSALVLFGCSLLFMLTTLGVGLFLSTISRTQQQAMMASFFFFTPAMLLSGFTFPIRNMPAPAQYLTYLNPLRYFIEIVRGIFLKGVGISILWPQMVALLVFGVTILGLSAARFRKRLD